MAVKKDRAVHSAGIEPAGLLHELPCPAAILRLDGSVISWNDEAAELLGWRVPLRRPRLGTSQSPWLRALRQRLYHDDRTTVLMRHRRSDERIVIELNARNTSSGDLFVLMRDCTEQVEARRKRKAQQVRAREKLRRSEEQLLHAQKMEAVGRLAAGIAHDFNNILTAIQGHVQFLLEDLPPVFASREDALEIRSAAERATELTRQLLTFARKQPAHPVLLDVNDVVLDVEKMLRRLLPSTVSLEKVLAEVPQVFADPGLLQQVIMNLVVNARDAMPDGGTITIRTSLLDLEESYTARGINLARGQYVQLAVSDTGRGMSADVQKQVFEPFFTTKEEGTGLGLSTVYGIVQQARGYVAVYSDIGVGTTFKVYLPAMEVANTAERNDKPVTERAGLVLLVEDDPPVRALATRILRQGGFDVLQAENAEDAMRLSRERGDEIDVVVTDLMLPNVRGDQLADRLSVSSPRTGVVLMSGYTEAAATYPPGQSKRWTFLEKPFTPEALVRAVRDVAPAR